MKAIPKRFPSVAVDRLINVLGDWVELMIQMEIGFDRSHELDADRLARAVELALDAEPILGCRFVPHPGRPYWERTEPDERRVFSLVKTEDEYEAFKTSSLDARTGPQIRVCLWRSSGGDRLLLKISHIASDAGGLKDAAAVVSSIYLRLAQEPDYRPAPNLTGSRSLWQVYRRVPWYEYPRIYLLYLIKLCRMMAPAAVHSISLEGSPDAPPAFVRRRIPRERVAALSKYGRSRGATLNDVMMAALVRAIAALGDRNGRARSGLWTTVDLRRYLPDGKAGSICNLSAMEPLLFGTEPGDDFDSTLARVTAITKRLKANWIGLSDYVGIAPAALLPYRWLLGAGRRLTRRTITAGRYLNAYTNMGPIAPASVAFGAKPKDAWLLPPPAYPPQTVIGMSGYDGSLTLAAGVYSESAQRVVAALLDEALSELPA